VRARVRAHVWSLIAATPAGFPWLSVAGKLLAGWLVIDLDATLITAHSEKQGAAPTFKKGYDLLTVLREVSAGQKPEQPWRSVTTLTGISQSACRSGRDLDRGATESGYPARNRSPASSSLLLVSTSPTRPRMLERLS
jgi:hypothetical protein